MGIQGLLPLLDPVLKDVHIEQYSGKKVAVDGRTWLYRGAFGCAYELCMNLDTNKYVTYFIQMVQILLFHNIIPIIVFEGQPLPLKGESKIQHLLKKEKNLHEGYFHAENGNIGEAKRSFQQGFSITEQMISAVIKALDQINVQHVVAPYDVGPQLTYMSENNQVEAVITEDSELIAFGCEKIIYKLDRQGNGKQLQFEDIFKAEKLNLEKFTKDMFRYMCITAGCDYLSSISSSPGVKRAQDLVQRHPTIDKLFKALRARFSTNITEPYMKGFHQADAAFLYQFVFDIDSRCYDRLNPFPKDMKVTSFYLLGQNPQNRYVSLLRSNNATRFPQFDFSETHKKDITVSQMEDQNLDDLEFDNANDIDLKGRTAIKPEPNTKHTKSEFYRPISIPKPIRRPYASNSKDHNFKPACFRPQILVKKKIPFTPLVDDSKCFKNSRPSCKVDVKNVNTLELKQHTTKYPVTTTRTPTKTKPRQLKRKLLTFDDALPPNKYTKLNDDEDPFGLDPL